MTVLRNFPSLRARLRSPPECPLAIFQPLLGLIKLPDQGATGFGAGPVQAHRNLAVGDFAQRATILSCHADRVLPGLGKRGFVNEPDFRVTEKIHHLARQAALDFFDGPGTLSHELTQGLNVGAFHAAGHRLDRLPLSIQEQAPYVDACPMLSFATPHRFEQVFKKMRQPGLEPFQGLRLHAAKVTDIAQRLKHDLT